MIKSDLETLHKWLSAKGFANSIVEKSNVFSGDRIMIDFEYENKDYPLVLQISVSNQDLCESDEIFELKEKPKNYELIDLYLGFPFQVDDQLSGDIATLVGTIDQGLEFPGLRYHLGRRQITYQHRYFTANNLIDTRLLIVFISFIHMTLLGITPLLIEVGTGKASLEQALTHLSELSKEK